MAFLDVTKVFDCVSHVTLQRSLKGLGVPSPIVAYVANMYEHMTTVLKVGGRRSGPIQCNRGIRQGDPLSSFLFNPLVPSVRLNGRLQNPLPKYHATAYWALNYCFQISGN